MSGINVQAHYDLVVQRLAESLRAARAGNATVLSAFRSVSIDPRKDTRSAKDMLPSLLKAGERLDPKQSTSVASTLLGNLDDLR
jgi:hypothetical protein